MFHACMHVHIIGWLDGWVDNDQSIFLFVVRTVPKFLSICGVYQTNSRRSTTGSRLRECSLAAWLLLPSCIPKTRLDYCPLASQQQCATMLISLRVCVCACVRVYASVHVCACMCVCGRALDSRLTCVMVISDVGFWFGSSRRMSAGCRAMPMLMSII